MAKVDVVYVVTEFETANDYEGELTDDTTIRGVFDSEEDARDYAESLGYTESECAFESKIGCVWQSETKDESIGRFSYRSYITIQGFVLR